MSDSGLTLRSDPVRPRPLSSVSMRPTAHLLMLRLIKEINAMYWSCAGVHFLKSCHHQQSYGSTPECKVIVICDGNMIMEVLPLSIIVIAYWQPWRPSIGGSYLKLTKVAINGPLRRLFCVRNILYAIKHFVTLDSRLLNWPRAQNSPTNTGPRTTFWMFRSKMLPYFPSLWGQRPIGRAGRDHLGQRGES